MLELIPNSTNSSGHKEFEIYLIELELESPESVTKKKETTKDNSTHLSNMSTSKISQED